MKGSLSGIAFFLFLALSSCTSEQKKIMFQGQTQGTTYTVTYFDSRGRNFHVQIDSILKAFDLSVSIWVPGSIISRINNGDSLVKPDEWFVDIFNRCEQISVKTGGAFDCTVGPLVNAWGFGNKGKLRMDQARVDSLLQYVGYQKASLDANQRIVKPKGVQFDFNAIAQGYAVDVLGNYLVGKGIKNFLVDIGGEVVGKGSKPDGQSWVVGIENPSADSTSESTINTYIELNGKAVSTSGNYRKYHEEKGIRYSHEIDPHTGYPVRHSLVSVTVMAADCATADGYATAFMVMGFEKAREFIENEPGMEAFFIISIDAGTWQTYATEGFKEVIVPD